MEINIAKILKEVKKKRVFNLKRFIFSVINCRIKVSKLEKQKILVVHIIYIQTKALTDLILLTIRAFKH